MKGGGFSKSAPDSDKRMIGNEGAEESNLTVVKTTERAKIWFVIYLYVFRCWKIHIITTSVSLFLRLTASFIVAAYEGWVKRKYEIVKRAKDKIKFQFISLIPERFSSSLTEITIYSGKFESVLHVFSIVNFQSKIKWSLKKEDLNNPKICLSQPEKSVSCDILYSPDEDKITADVIFIHGLHGSIVHTWKQGLWRCRKEVTYSTLTHKYNVPKNPTIESDVAQNTKSKKNDRKQNLNNDGSDEDIGTCDNSVNYTHSKSRSTSRTSHSSKGDDHDVILENITDILNNIDDKIKETKRTLIEKRTESEPYSPCWPRDWLPKDCPGIRVIAINYTTDPFLWRPVWITKRIRTSITERSVEMEEHLLKIGVGQKPIVWVGHSKGGLYVKQMLIDAKSSKDPLLKKFLCQTKAIMFYSVPHRGSALAHISVPFLRQSIELTELKKDCQELLNLHNNFMNLYKENSLTAEVYSFVETILTFMFIVNVRVVSVDSADLGFGEFQGVNIDHREICKPLNRNCLLYKELVNLINRIH